MIFFFINNEYICSNSEIAQGLLNNARDTIMTTYFDLCNPSSKLR